MRLAGESLRGGVHAFHPTWLGCPNRSPNRSSRHQNPRRADESTPRQRHPAPPTTGTQNGTTPSSRPEPERVDHRQALSWAPHRGGGASGSISRSLPGVELDDVRAIPRAAVFVRPRFVPNNDLLVGLGCAVEETGWVIADATGGTNGRCAVIIAVVVTARRRWLTPRLMSH